MHLKEFSRQVTGAFTLSADSPLLIKAGASNKTDPALPDALFLTGSDGGTETYVIPGSSLKGVIRHYLEDNQILSTAEAESLFGRQEGSLLRGRISLSDGYADPKTVHLVRRTNTALGGISQSVTQGSLNTTDTLDRGEFPCSFRILNPTPKDVCALLFALDAMHRHLLFIGGRSGKGYGRVSVKQFEMRVVEGFTPELAPQISAYYQSLPEALAAFRKEYADAK